jgi:hypothetical protein
MTNQQPTPRPWSMVSGSNTIVIYNDKLLRQIAYLYGGADHSEANAAHIVHCVNTFDALLEAAEAMIGIINACDDCRYTGEAVDLCVAIEKARGK